MAVDFQTAMPFDLGGMGGNIGMINLYNRLNVTTRQVPGSLSW